ncbi:MAG: hypothetical protein JXA90_16585, partial [Planctomycetes bacterium]|nr:hypothetical protein [Planctomycetota bacterium]
MRASLLFLIAVSFASTCCLGLRAAGSGKVRDHEIAPEDIFDVATVTALQVSPDGRHAAYVE